MSFNDFLNTSRRFQIRNYRNAFVYLAVYADLKTVLSVF